MNIQHDPDTAGLWVRLLRAGTTVGLDRWPGPHRPGTVIHTSGAGRFCFSHLDPHADGGPEAVYSWTAT